MAIVTKSFSRIISDIAAAAQASASQAAVPRQLDFTVGSILRALSEGFGAVAMWLQATILQVLALTRASTSTGTDLDSWMADYGLTREAAVASEGVVRFSRFTAGQAAFIPVNAAVRSADGTLTFTVQPDTTNGAYSATLNGYTIPAGTTFLDVLVSCSTAGAAGNAAANTITLLVSGIPYVDAVTNPNVLTGGADAETDAAFRQRFWSYLASLSKATNLAVSYAISLVQPGLQWEIVEYQDTSNAARDAYFYVVVDDGTGNPTDALVQRVLAAVDEARPLGVSFAVVKPVVLNADVTMSITTASGSNHAQVVGLVSNALTTYINSLPLGAGLSYTRLAAVAYNASSLVTEVSGYTLNGASSDLAGVTRRAIRAGAIGVT